MVFTPSDEIAAKNPVPITTPSRWGYVSLTPNFTPEIVSKIIREAVNQLSEKFKTVITLRDIQQLSYEDISEIIDVPIGTVKSRINRARLQLQVELKHLKK